MDDVPVTWNLQLSLLLILYRIWKTKYLLSRSRPEVSTPLTLKRWTLSSASFFSLSFSLTVSPQSIYNYYTPISSVYLTSCFLNIHINIILLYTPMSPKWALSFRFSDKKKMHFSAPPCVLFVQPISSALIWSFYVFVEALTFWSLYRKMCSISVFSWNMIRLCLLHCRI
jgi:hypothetical protein